MTVSPMAKGITDATIGQRAPGLLSAAFARAEKIHNFVEATIPQRLRLWVLVARDGTASLPKLPLILLVSHFDQNLLSTSPYFIGTPIKVRGGGAVERHGVVDNGIR